MHGAKIKIIIASCLTIIDMKMSGLLHYPAASTPEKQPR